MTGLLSKVTAGSASQARRYRMEYDGHFLFAGSLDRLLALYLWKYGVLERFELELARSLIVPGSVVLDVGANIGFHAIHFAKCTGPTGHVYAFEPEPDNFAVLQANIAASGLSHITARELAISDTIGTVDLYVSASHRGDHRIFSTPERRNVIKVNSTTLDAMFSSSPQSISLIKIDVQGAEAEVLRGMRGLLEAHPEAAVVAEFSPALMREMSREPLEVVHELASLSRTIERIDETSARCIVSDLDELVHLSATARDMNLLLLPFRGERRVS